MNDLFGSAISNTILMLCTVFYVFAGFYDSYIGFKSIREARAQEPATVWYKTDLLLGVQSTLTALVFLLILAIRSNLIPSSLNRIFVPLDILLFALLLGVFIFRLTINKPRKAQQVDTSANSLEQPIRENVL